MVVCSTVGFSQDGSPDTSFGDNGVLVTQVDNADKWVQGIDQSVTGRILISGHYFDSNLGISASFLLAYFEDGSVDTSFANNGVLWTAGSIGSYRTIILQPDEKALIDRFIGSNYSIIRLLQNGDVDTSFGNNGELLPFASEVSGMSMIVDQENKILTLGIDDSGSEPNLMISKFLSSGAIDTSFGNNGMVSHPLGSVSDVWTSSFLLFNNKLHIAFGYAENNTESDHIVRFLSNGALDTTFGNNGVATIPVEEEYDCIVSIFNDGSFLVGATYWDQTLFTMIRKTIKLKPDATPDENFGNGGSLEGFSGGYIQENQRFISNSSNVDFEGGISLDYSRFFQNGGLDTSFEFSNNYIELGGAFFQPLNSGSFLIAGSDIWYNGPELKVVLQKFNNSPLSISEFNLNNLKIFPNPSSNAFVVQRSDALGIDLPFQITDVSGKQIMKGTLSGYQTTIDLSSAQSGIYFLNTPQGSARLIKN